MGTTPTASTEASRLARQGNDRALREAPDLPAMFDRYREHLENALAAAVPPLEGHAVNALLRYHLGWPDRTGTPAATPASQGKALRPTLCMFACHALQGDPARAAPAAAALELIHNFSLVHDDIQDQGMERRHQPTVWAVWGTEQALVAGDAMQSLGDLSALNVGGSAPPDTTIRVSQLLTQSYLEMIEGQCRDLEFERREVIASDEYLDMIALKTGALIRSSMVIGATIATHDIETLEGVARFGRAIGRLFQIRDDYLGIWGDEAITGKSTDSDIVQRKKSYPIVCAFQHAEGANRDELLRLYAQEELDEDDVNHVLNILDDLGADRQTDELTEATAEEGRAALALLELPPWAAEDAKNLIDFMAYRLF
ncbi:MAG: polyprenyl synthetase family protein [Chloroflexota bacterium]|nr:polyprenyl synthetase family protein [Chloroflexota bacterium]MDE2961063.1 polyprenyl synthetase family protein [Chloroflexota bacterium]